MDSLWKFSRSLKQMKDILLFNKTTKFLKNEAIFKGITTLK